MLERLYIENYGCIVDADFKLSPLHALIGANDCGKSTVLRALRTLSLLSERDAMQEAPDREAIRAGLTMKAGGEPVSLAAQVSGLVWKVQAMGSPGLYEKTFGAQVGDIGTSSSLALDVERGSKILRERGYGELARSLAGSQLVRLEPEVLRRSSGLIPDGQVVRFTDERGGGLPGVYDALLTRDLAGFMAINTRLSELFPAVKGLQLKNRSQGEKALGVVLHDGTEVGAESMSEGLLYYLAFAALAHLDRAGLLLIEEPEHGLHPSRIPEVVHTLREISKTTQVILTTHSPLVVHELAADEVSVLTRTREEGTKATLLRDTPNFEEGARECTLGALWAR